MQNKVCFMFFFDYTRKLNFLIRYSDFRLFKYLKFDFSMPTPVRLTVQAITSSFENYVIANSINVLNSIIITQYLLLKYVCINDNGGRVQKIF